METDKSNGVDGLVRLQRPGLRPFVTVGAGPINAVWRQAGTFGGDFLVVSGPALHRVTSKGVTTVLGGVANQRAQIAASATRAIIVNGGIARSTDGLTVTQVVMPDGVPVGSVGYINGYFFLSVENSQRVYYIEPGQTDPDALSFFEAERKPDPIVTIAVVGDELWFIGAESEEVWALTGDIDAPAQRVNARAYENGCAARDTLVEFNTSLAWVTSDFRVVISSGNPQSISTPAITEHLQRNDPASLRAWHFKQDGHLFYVLTGDVDTFAYDVSTQIWSRFSSYGAENWRAHLGADEVCGDAQSGALWKLDTTLSNDAGENMVREITGGVEITGAPVRCDSVNLRVAAGWSPRPDFEPVLEMRWSDDEGATWGQWRRVGLGKQGRYKAPVAFRKLGMMRRPGRLFWFRATDDALLRISYCQVNEAFS